jgi:hypothetical protein
MDQSDIIEVKTLLREAISEKNWDLIYDATDYLSEFIDSNDPESDE